MPIDVCGDHDFINVSHLNWLQWRLTDSQNWPNMSTSISTLKFERKNWLHWEYELTRHPFSAIPGRQILYRLINDHGGSILSIFLLQIFADVIRAQGLACWFLRLDKMIKVQKKLCNIGWGRDTPIVRRGFRPTTIGCSTAVIMPIALFLQSPEPQS